MKKYKNLWVIIPILLLIGVAIFFSMPQDQETLVLRPNAIGTYTELTPGSPNNWAQVDEVVADTGTIVFNGYPKTLAKDTYNIEDHTLEAQEIVGVTIYTRAWHDKTTSKVRPVIYTENNVYFGEYNYLSTTWTTFDYTWTTNPYTGKQWTWDEIDDLEIGGQLSTGIPTNARITQVYAEVVYKE